MELKESQQMGLTPGIGGAGVDIGNNNNNNKIKEKRKCREDEMNGMSQGQT